MGAVPSAVIPVWCNDLMFSGHTATNVLCCLITSASPAHAWFKALHWFMVLGMMAVSVATRDHYTADCLISVYLTVAVFQCRRSKVTALFSPLTPSKHS